jgi:hypothetical protein
MVSPVSLPHHLTARFAFRSVTIILVLYRKSSNRAMETGYDWCQGF